MDLAHYEFDMGWSQPIRLAMHARIEGYPPPTTSLIFIVPFSALIFFSG
jgi:hypothetical protein